MTDQNNHGPGAGGPDNLVPPESDPLRNAKPQPVVFPQQLHNDPIGARVPESVGQGAFCTGTIVLEGPEEFVIDFVQGLARPPRLASRVILSPRVMSQFVAALRENLQKYESAFGPPKELPRPPADRMPKIDDIYRDLKLPDELLSGHYATAVMISHTPGDFSLDFITRFYPTASVSARVYMSASQAPRMLETLTTSLNHFMQRTQRPPAGPQGEQGQAE